MMLLASCASNRLPKSYCWNDDLHQRLFYDFTKSQEDVKQYIKKYIPDVTENQMKLWENSRALEYMNIDGKEIYFKNAAPNLFRIDTACVAIKRKQEGFALSDYQKEDSVNLPQIIQFVAKSDNNPHCLAVSKRMRVTYTLTVKADAVPAGQKIRCWLPFPRSDQFRQKDVKLLSTSEKKYMKSNPKCEHSTIYMEKKAEAGKPTVFSEMFEYTSYGEKHFLSDGIIKPYDKRSKLYKEYTAEREKHIVFAPQLCQLADSLTKGLTSPVEKAQAIFCWINGNFPWASAREYSTIDNIPEYVLLNHHADCGQVSLLFITLCRICGIPAHFQSGFMMHPHGAGMHDWAEIYFEGIGWVPVDQSFGRPRYAHDDIEKMFFLGGIDSWRMIVNNDFGKPLSPRKLYPRSETVDFQRGEVEWAGGNIYFDKWNYDLDVTYLDK